MLRLSTVGAISLLLLTSSAVIAQCDESAVPVTNAPYSAVHRTVTIERHPDGTSTRSEATKNEARDSKGRTYSAGERRWTTLVDGKSVEKSEMQIRISDPVANTETTWDTSTKIAKVVHFPSSDDVSGGRVNVDAFSFEATAKRMSGTTLGSRTIEGLSVEGIGFHTKNSTHECWFSRDLKKAVLRTDEYSDSSFTDRLEEVVRGEPDISRYRVPSGYSVNHVYVPQSGTQ